ncbi:DUF5908 family protein [Sphaerotilus sp.]|uniref:DUF5908 family protein n=1 Tax=Sphaerotilus sp. TaxID=2093942 RepID=UPI00286E5DF9|nr:DUF5908 family protein [Sphaerotilus sp.]
MPILIDEIVIQVEVSNVAGGGTSTPPAPGTDKQALVAECVERVLDILRQQKEA